MEASSSVFLKPCAGEAKKEGDSSKSGEAAEPMEVLDSRPTKRKAEDDLKKEEEIEEKKIILPERERYLEPPDYGVDSFDGEEYSTDSEPERYSDDEERDLKGEEDYRIYKRQLIESKGFKVDPGLKPSNSYKAIAILTLDRLPDYRNYCEKMVSICLDRFNQDKPKEDFKVEFVKLVSANFAGYMRTKHYITFMAKEKPDGPQVEYQAKGMGTPDSKMHPIFCRPAPTQTNTI